MNAAALTLVILSTAGQPDIQGTWTGTGRDARYTAVFCDGILAMRVGADPILKDRESCYSLNPDQGTIDIQRSDGLQLGRYAIEGDTLTIMLGDVNRPRPMSIEFPSAKLGAAPVQIDRKAWTSPTQQRYIFERRH